jgi:NADPH:quinone reductase
MRVVAYRSAGSAREVLGIEEIPDCEPGPDDVRIRLHYSAVNPTDVKRRAVEHPAYGSAQIPHHDGSGYIDRIGINVSPERLGQAVWVYHAAHERMFGTAAEYVCVPSAHAIALPSSMDLMAAALIGIPMMTAAHAVNLGGDLSHQHVLVTGGAGAVGSAAISMAKSKGAHVTALVSSPQKGAIAQAAGADQVLDYHAIDVEAHLSSQDTTYDHVIDVAIGSHLPRYITCLNDQARIVSYSSDGPELHTSVRPLMFRNIRMEFFVIYSLPPAYIQRAVETVSRALEEGVRPVTPTQVFSLDECALAHEFVEDHSLGRAVIDINAKL